MLIEKNGGLWVIVLMMDHYYLLLSYHFNNYFIKLIYKKHTSHTYYFTLDVLYLYVEKNYIFIYTRCPLSLYREELHTYFTLDVLYLYIVETKEDKLFIFLYIEMKSLKHYCVFFPGYFCVVLLICSVTIVVCQKIVSQSNFPI